MATFSNVATLSYGGNTVYSNVVTGTLLETVSMTKSVALDIYSTGKRNTFIVSVINAGQTDVADVTLTENLGEYNVGTTPVIPMTYLPGSLLYYLNGVAQPTPTVASESPLTLTGISIPAGGEAIFIYQAEPNQYADGSAGSSITTVVTLTGDGIPGSLEATAILTAADAPILSITKNLSPTTASEAEQIVYTITVQNTGNQAVTAADNVVIGDTLNPTLTGLSVTYNGTAWVEGTQYQYSQTGGEFSTTAGAVTVPAATYTQDSTTGVVTVTPGTAVLVLTGNISV